LQTPQSSGLLAVAAGVKVHHRHARSADVREHLLIARPGLVHAAGGGDDDKVGVLTPRDPHEALEDAAVIFLILCATDRNDLAALLTVGNSAGHPSETPHQTDTQKVPRRRGSCRRPLPLAG